MNGNKNMQTVRNLRRAALSEFATYENCTNGDALSVLALLASGFVGSIAIKGKTPVEEVAEVFRELFQIGIDDVKEIERRREKAEKGGES